ncbi:DUF1852 domain-containing protein [Salipiger sp. PrR002]|uniref:DUF1852 domain-containing protein n=1 Tax=Salipiger sp. PrR002 TaxID=2706489 RepID=UPI0013BB41A8|nr:DUF1852 domain-containing protein [Salipiger sp. PrR002]NDW00204.1 DUF1852 domain-containing protein [Salipiger sp. PrR002]NDW56787.1 DUF1852 domain-containing protein [Salipiger sp. PrR004]
MPEPSAFKITSLRFDEDYMPTDSTRLTTNFANLARGSNRRQNLTNALRMIDNRFNDLAHWDNPSGDRYAVELDIISVDLDVDGKGQAFPVIEVLKTTIHDRQTDARIDGLVGNNFSSYLRDYDFSVVLPAHRKARDGISVPDDFGELHGNIFRAFVASEAFRAQFRKPPVICISVSESKTYRRTTNAHPVLGVEYEPSGASLTEQYFRKMGMQVRYFMPPRSVAPLAFYFIGDLLNDYTNLELIGTISTMEAFQKIYRPEIYNANSEAGHCYKPSLKHRDFSPTRVIYDREERARLATEQGRFAEEHFIKPHLARLGEWSAQSAV